MKKRVILFVSLSAVLLLAACEKEKETKTEEKKETVTIQTVPTDTGKEVVTVPKEELEKTAKATSVNVVLFQQKQIEAEDLFTEYVTGKTEEATFKASYQTKMKELKQVVKEIETKAKEDTYNDSEKKYVAYFSDVVKQLEKKEDIFDQEGKIKEEERQKIDQKIASLSSDYEALFQTQ